MPGPFPPSDPRNYVGIGKQTGRAALGGVGIAPSLFAAYIETVELDHQQTLNRIMEASAGGQVTYTEKAGHAPTGRFRFFARPKIVTQMSAYLLGVDTPGAAVLGVTPHVLTEDWNTDYLSVEQNLGDEVIERFVNCVIAEMTFEATPDNPVLRCTSSWIGCQPGWKTAVQSETYETEEPWKLSEFAFTTDGTPSTNVRRFSATVRFRYAAEKTTDVVPEYLVKVAEEVEFEVEQLMIGISEAYRETHYGSPTGTTWTKTAKGGSFIADANRGTGGAADSRQFKLEIPNLDYSTSVYTPLAPDTNEAVKHTRTGVARVVLGTPLTRITGKTLDAAAYV